MSTASLTLSRSLTLEVYAAPPDGGQPVAMTIKLGRLAAQELAANLRHFAEGRQVKHSTSLHVGTCLSAGTCMPAPTPREKAFYEKMMAERRRLEHPGF